MYDFIHVGFGKCMSTTLQSLWGASSNYGLHSPDAVLSNINRAFVDHAPDVETTIARLSTLNFEVQDRTRGDINVLSSEGLSFSFLANPDLGDYVLLRQAFLANVMGHLSSRVLVLIRDPIDWVRSAHAQLVRQGDYLDIATFVRTHRSVILNNLNLGATLKYWTDADCEVVVLPMEQYQSAPADFWATYEQRLGVAAPDSHAVELDDLSANVTRYDTLDIHRTLNAMLSLTQQVLGRGDFVDKAECTKALDYARQWATRRALTITNDEENEAFRQLLNTQALPAQPLSNLDDDFVNYLQAHFINAIPDESHIQRHDIVRRYQDNLNQYKWRREEPQVAGAAAL